MGFEDLTDTCQDLGINLGKNALLLSWYLKYTRGINTLSPPPDYLENQSSFASIVMWQVLRTASLVSILDRVVREMILQSNGMIPNLARNWHRLLFSVLSWWIGLLSGLRAALKPYKLDASTEYPSSMTRFKIKIVLIMIFAYTPLACAHFITSLRHISKGQQNSCIRSLTLIPSSICSCLEPDKCGLPPHHNFPNHSRAFHLYQLCAKVPT